MSILKYKGRHNRYRLKELIASLRYAECANGLPSNRPIFILLQIVFTAMYFFKGMISAVIFRAKARTPMFRQLRSPTLQLPQESHCQSEQRAAPDMHL